MRILFVIALRLWARQLGHERGGGRIGGWYFLATSSVAKTVGQGLEYRHTSYI